MPLLIVEDDRDVARSLDRMLHRYCELRVAESIAEARGVVDAGNVVAALVDEGLPDGSGLDFVAYLRRRRPAVPVLVFTAQRDLALVNRAQSLRAEFVFKPAEPGNVIPFVREALARAGGADQRLEQAVDQLARMTGLTPREQEILNLALAGVPRAAMAGELEMSSNTLKSTIRKMLERTGEETLEELARSVFEAALRAG